MTLLRWQSLKVRGTTVFDECHMMFIYSSLIWQKCCVVSLNIYVRSIAVQGTTWQSVMTQRIHTIN